MPDESDAARPAQPSLAGRLVAIGRISRDRLRGAATGLSLASLLAVERRLTPVRVAMLAPALILASGVVTAGSAQLLADHHRRAAAALAPRAAPLLAASRGLAARTAGASAARGLLEGATVTAVLERLARELPDGVQIASIAREADGRIRLGLLAVDPDRLRGSAALAGFRQLDQRRDDSGRILILLEAKRR